MQDKTSPSSRPRTGEAFGAEFLRFPDLFPRRVSGEPWGDGQVRIDFLGGPYLVDGLDERQLAVVKSQWGELCTTTRVGAQELGSNCVRFGVFRAASSDFVELELANWHNTLDLDFLPQRVRLAGRFLQGVIELPGRERTSGLWCADVPPETFAGVFENYFRVAVAYRLLELGGVLLHSAGVVDRERVCLFVGHSGAGKSTVARLSLDSGRHVLSDDLNAVLPVAGNEGHDPPSGFIVERVPFAGDLARTDMAREQFPLQAIFVLSQSSSNAVNTVSRASGLAGLLSSAPFVNSDPLRSAELDRILLSLFRPVEHVVAPRLGRLHFQHRDAGFWDAIRAFLDETEEAPRQGPANGSEKRC